MASAAQSAGSLRGSLHLDAAQFLRKTNRAIHAIDMLETSMKVVEQTAVMGGIAITASGLAHGAAIHSMVKQSTAMEQALARTFSVGQLATEEIDRLTAAALDLGRGAVGPIEVADALYNLASAGFETEEQLAALPEIINFAVSQAIDLSVASELVTAAMASWGIAAEDVARITNVVAASNAVSASNALRLAAAFRFAGPASAAFGVEIEEAVAVLNLLITVMQNGEMAGTAYRNMLMQLTPANTSLAAEAERVGISLQRLNSRTQDMGSLVEAIREASEAGIDWFAALAQRGGQAATIVALLGDQYQDMYDSISDTNEASRQFGIQMETVAARQQRLRNSIQSTAAMYGDILRPVVLAVTQAFQDFVDFLALIPAPYKALIMYNVLLLTALKLFIGPLTLLGALFSSLARSILKAGAASLAYDKVGGKLVTALFNVGKALLNKESAARKAVRGLFAATKATTGMTAAERAAQDVAAAYAAHRAATTAAEKAATKVRLDAARARHAEAMAEEKLGRGRGTTAKATATATSTEVALRTARQANITATGALVVVEAALTASRAAQIAQMNLLTAAYRAYMSATRGLTGTIAGVATAQAAANRALTAGATATAASATAASAASGKVLTLGGAVMVLIRLIGQWLVHSGRFILMFGKIGALIGAIILTIQQFVRNWEIMRVATERLRETLAPLYGALGGLGAAFRFVGMIIETVFLSVFGGVAAMLVHVDSALRRAQHSTVGWAAAMRDAFQERSLEPLERWRDGFRDLREEHEETMAQLYRRVDVRMADMGLMEATEQIRQYRREIQAMSIDWDQVETQLPGVMLQFSQLAEGMVLNVDTGPVQQAFDQVYDDAQDLVDKLIELAEQPGYEWLGMVTALGEQVTDETESVLETIIGMISDATEKAKQVIADNFIRDLRDEADRRTIAAMRDNRAQLLAEYEMREREITRIQENAQRELVNRAQDLAAAMRAVDDMRLANREQYAQSLEQLEDRIYDQVVAAERRVIDERIRQMQEGEGQIRAQAAMALRDQEAATERALEGVRVGSEAYQRILDADQAMQALILEKMTEDIADWAAARTQAFAESARQFESAMQDVQQSINRLGAELDDDPVSGMFQRQSEEIQANRAALRRALEREDQALEANQISRATYEQRRIALIEKHGNLELMLYQKHGEEYRDHLADQEVAGLRHIEALRAIDAEIAGLALATDYEKAEARRRNDLAALDAWYEEMQLRHRDNEDAMAEATDIYFARRRLIIETFHADERQILADAERAYESFAATFEQTMARIEGAARRRQVQREGTPREQMEFQHAEELAEHAAALTAALDEIDTMVENSVITATDAYWKRIEVAGTFADLESEILADHVDELADLEAQREADAIRHAARMQAGWAEVTTAGLDGLEALEARLTATLAEIGAEEEARAIEAGNTEEAIVEAAEWAALERARVTGEFHRESARLRERSHRDAVLDELRHQDQMADIATAQAVRATEDAVQAVLERADAERGALDRERQRRLLDAGDDAAALVRIDEWYHARRVEIEEETTEAVHGAREQAVGEFRSAQQDIIAAAEEAAQRVGTSEMARLHLVRDMRLDAAAAERDFRLAQLDEDEDSYAARLAILSDFEAEQLRITQESTAAIAAERAKLRVSALEHADQVERAYARLALVGVEDDIERARLQTEQQLAELARAREIALARAGDDAAERLRIEERYQADRAVLIATGENAVRQLEERAAEQRRRTLEQLATQLRDIAEETTGILIGVHGTERQQERLAFAQTLLNLQRRRDAEILALREQLGDTREYHRLRGELERTWNARIEAERHRHAETVAERERQRADEIATVMRESEGQRRLSELELARDDVAISEERLRQQINAERRGLNERMQALGLSVTKRRRLIDDHLAWERLEEQKHHDTVQDLYRTMYDSAFEHVVAAEERVAEQREALQGSINDAITQEIALLRERNQELLSALGNLSTVRSYYEQVQELYGMPTRGVDDERAFVQRQLAIADRLYKQAVRANLPLRERQALLQDVVQLNERVVELGGEGVAQDVSMVQAAADELRAAENEAANAARQYEQNERQITLLSDALEGFEAGIGGTTEELGRLVEQLQLLNTTLQSDALEEALGDFDALAGAARESREAWVEAFAGILEEVEPGLRGQAQEIASMVLELFERDNVGEGLYWLARFLGGAIPRGILEGLLEAPIPGDPTKSLVERLGVTDDLRDEIVKYWARAPRPLDYEEVLKITSDEEDEVVEGIEDLLEEIERTAAEGAIAAGRAAGVGLMNAFADGIRSGQAAVLAAVQDVLQQVRAYLPSSDAKIGPLSDLTVSGGALVRTFVKGAERQEGYLTRHIDNLFGSASPRIAPLPGGQLGALGGAAGGAPVYINLPVEGGHAPAPVAISARSLAREAMREARVLQRMQGGP